MLSSWRPVLACPGHMLAVSQADPVSPAPSGCSVQALAANTGHSSEMSTAQGTLTAWGDTNSLGLPTAWGGPWLGGAHSIFCFLLSGQLSSHMDLLNRMS